MHIIIGVVVVLIVGVVVLLSSVYKKSSKDLAFIRTGQGDQAVVFNGGAFVFPVIHASQEIYMSTCKIVVENSREDSLMTKDRLKIDIIVEFFTRITPTKPAINLAAQTLGKNANNKDAINELVKGKFIDALRAVSMSMNMDQLYENRDEFRKLVQEALVIDLQKNGLELDTPSIISLNQTDIKHYDPENSLDAEGLKKLTEKIETSRVEKNNLEQTSKVAIETRNLSSKKDMLELNKESELAELTQKKSIEENQTSQRVHLAKIRAEARLDEETSQIEAERGIETSKIGMEQSIKIASINSKKETDVLDMKSRKTISIEKTENEREIEVAEKDKYISISKKAEEETQSKSNLLDAEKETISKEEALKTFIELEKANRIKKISVVEAEREALIESTKMEIISNSELVVSRNEAESEKLLTEVKERNLQVDAKGVESMNVALNLLNNEQIDARNRQLLIEMLPEFIKNAVAPMENIDSIKIIDTGNSLTGNNDGGSDDGTGASGIVNAALKYKGVSPLMDTLLDEVGLKGGVEGLASGKEVSSMIESIKS